MRGRTHTCWVLLASDPGFVSGIFCLHAIIIKIFRSENVSNYFTHCPLEKCHEQRSVGEILLVDHLQTGNKMH